MKNYLLLIAVLGQFVKSYGQTLTYSDRTFEIVAVNASVVEFEGEEVIKVERDLEALPFDIKKLGSTVDEPTYIKLTGLNLENGVVEVKVLSRLQTPSPFQGSQGFIGLAFRINEDNTAYESVYLRPRVGRSENQFARNHTVQYYAYPDFKFDKLRKAEYRGQYETYADIALDEWITMRIEFQDKKAKLYLNDQEAPAFIADELLGSTTSGSIALWVDIGTVGYFKDLKIKQ